MADSAVGGDTADIVVDGVNKSFQTEAGPFEALRDVSLRVEHNEFAAFVGPSGCGKTTLLRIIAGLIPQTSGTITVGGQEVRGLNSHVSFFFQKDVVLPWKTVLQNVMLPQILRGTDREASEDKAREWIRLVGLTGFEHYFPNQLSGGMRKRVGIATTMVADSHIILMDEPFGSLDVQTRNILETELLRIWKEHTKTIVFVTHDLEEAIGLADRVIAFGTHPGRVKAEYRVPIERPRDLFEVRLQPEFQEISRHLWSDLREEVLRSRQQA